MLNLVVRKETARLQKVKRVWPLQILKCVSSHITFWIICLPILNFEPVNRILRNWRQYYVIPPNQLKPLLRIMKSAAYCRVGEHMSVQL